MKDTIYKYLKDNNIYFSPCGNIKEVNRILNFININFIEATMQSKYYFIHTYIFLYNNHIYFTKYPTERTLKICKEYYLVKKSDLINELSNATIEEAQLFINEQVICGNKPDVRIFQRNLNANKFNRGFDHNLTCDGNNYWNTLINNIFKRTDSINLEKDNIIEYDKYRD